MSSGEDRISLLSDDLLRHILSFVDPCTRFHARTSVLSKRWRHLWAHHPNLHLSVPEPPTEKSNKEIKSIRRSYVRSVQRCLKSFDPASLHSFTVCLFHFHHAAGHRWLRFAALKSVKDLTVLGRFATRRGRDGGFCLIPRSLFLCQDITNLAIHSGTLRNVPRSFQGFRGLKNLSFVRVHVSNKTLADLLDSCPLLECLTLDECEGLTCLKIDSKNLARLFLDTTYTEMELSIEAPNLEAIHLEGDLIELDWKGSSVLLSEASLLVYALDEQWIRLACAVSNVSVLNTNSCFFQFGDPKGFSEEPLFENLKELNCDFDWFTSYMLIGLTNCLGECPQLEKLLVNLSYEMRSIAIGRANVLGYGESADDLLKYVDNVHEREIGNPTNHLGALGYSLDYLRTVTVKGFIGSKNEMRLAQFLLGKASVLEKFIIHDFLKREEMELQEVFANVLRASPHVQMIFNN